MIDQSPTVRVRVRRDGVVVHEEACESMEQAMLVVEAWEDAASQEGGPTTCEIIDELSSAEPDDPTVEPSGDDYPHTDAR